MLIMVCYFKKICGINQAEDLVTWPDLLHRHTSALASFREWSVLSAWLRIQAQPRNPCQPRNLASASTWVLVDEKTLLNCQMGCWQIDLSRLRPNWIMGPGPKSRSAGKSESRGPENGISRWQRPNFDIDSQNYHFGLVYVMTWYINFLAWRQRIISVVSFANNAIHPWPQVMLIFDWEMPPGFTPAICLCHNYVYISNLEDQGDKSLNQTF